MKTKSFPVRMAALVLLATISFTSGAEVTARFFRFTPTKLRTTAANSIQLAEFDLLHLGSRIAGATATNPGGSNPPGELPPLAVDENTGTKWLDFNKGPLVLEFPAAVTADSYRYATANDATERDPVSWLMESSDDGAAWTIIEARSDVAITTARFTYTQDFAFPAQVPLEVVSFSANRPKIGAGESLTLSWQVVGSTGVSIAPGVGNVAASGQIDVNPVANTTYTLTANKGATTMTRQVSVEVIALGSHTYRYFRFTPTRLRGEAANSIQLAEFEMQFNGTALPGAIASNPLGNNPANETPDLAVDGNILTKWLDFNKTALVLDFGSDVTANGYRFATANDSDERDPVDWMLEGSPDENTWTLIDAVTAYPTPQTRQVYSPVIPTPVEVPPAIVSFTADPQHLLPGESTTLAWETLRAQTVQIVPAVPSGGDLSGTVVVTPAAPTTWTLTATNGAGPVSRQVSVHVEGPAQQVSWRYFRFTPVRLRNGPAADSVQLAEFELSVGGEPVPGAVATNPGGNNPGTETPDFAVDLSAGTKWLDFNKGPLVLEYPQAVTIDSYRFATASDAPERDPVEWTFEGSADGETWTLIDSRNLELAIPSARETYSNYFHFAGSAARDYVRVTQITYNKAAQSASLTWDSEPGRFYLVERSATLSAWETALDNVASGGTATSQTLNVTGLPKVFFRVIRKPL